MMTQTRSSLTKNGFFKQWLNKKLTPRIKRYFFLTSLWSYFEGDKEYDRETLKKLNLVMALGSTEDTLFIPALLGNLIWKKILTIDPEYAFLTEKGKTEVNLETQALMHAAEVAPQWLQYATKEVIQKDIENLVLHMQSQ